jgi:predicted nuclease of predicted toxin-antitoxin system
VSDVRYMLDEHVPPAVAEQIRRHAIRCSSVREVGRLGLADAEQLRLASEDGFAFVSHDSDFSVLARSNVEHAGILICRPHTREVGATVRALLAFAQEYSAEEVAGQIWYI